MNQYVIIGNGVAAAGCIEGIRSMDLSSSITVISEEQYPVYCRPLISYYLEGKTTLAKMNYRPADFYEKNNVQVIYGQKAVAIDVHSNLITLSDGSSIPYTQICLATGSSPFTPPFKGLDTVANKHTFLTLDDALGLEKAIAPDSRVLIVGAGLIGLKCAEGILERVASITVCDLANRILSSIMDQECADMMATALTDKGVRLMLGDTVTEFKTNDSQIDRDGDETEYTSKDALQENAGYTSEPKSYTALMKSGEKVDFDVLVLAVGVRANTGLAAKAGCDVNRGVLINDRMETTVPGIYAAGDCSEGYDSSLGENRVLAILPNAYMQGRCAGINMTGGEDVFDKGIPMNSIGFFGLHAMSAGSYFEGGPDDELYEEKTDYTLKKMYIHNGQLSGYVLIGNIDRAGIYTALIREKTPLDTLDFDSLKKNPDFTGFSAESRSKKFGGVV